MFTRTSELQEDFKNEKFWQSALSQIYSYLKKSISIFQWYEPYKVLLLY